MAALTPGAAVIAVLAGGGLICVAVVTGWILRAVTRAVFRLACRLAGRRRVPLRDPAAGHPDLDVTLTTRESAALAGIAARLQEAR